MSQLCIFRVSVVATGLLSPGGHVDAQPAVPAGPWIRRRPANGGVRTADFARRLPLPKNQTPPGTLPRFPRVPTARASLPRAAPAPGAQKHVFSASLPSFPIAALIVVFSRVPLRQVLYVTQETALQHVNPRTRVGGNCAPREAHSFTPARGVPARWSVPLPGLDPCPL